MSTNAKNVPRPEFLKNFTTKIKRRYIVIESVKNSSLDFQKIVNEVNTKVNQIIQEINVKIVDRQVPYITLIAQYNASLNERSRIVVHNQRSSTAYRDCVRDQSTQIGTSVSHCVDLLISEGYKEITISSFEYDAEIVVGHHFITCAIIDLLLDIAMFNSYSFLKEKQLSWKHNFSFEKYDFFQSKKLDCFYECKSSKKLYYAFAFSARQNEEKFDVDQYIDIWNGFISQKYRHCKHCEKTILQQLQQHVDFKELPASLVKTLESFPPGAYLLLRTNKDRTENLHPFICNTFGLEEYEKGKIKLVPIEEFEKYRPMLENLDVSAFKVVVSSQSQSSSESDKGKRKDAFPIKKYPACIPEPKKKKRFRIALSFPGEHRYLVEPIAEQLTSTYGTDDILYDRYLVAEFARPNLDVYLQDLYSNDSELIVIFICAEYNVKSWCGIEWRGIRTVLNSKDYDRIMFIKCGDGEIDGIHQGIDGYVDASRYSTNDLANFIIARYNMLCSSSDAGVCV